MPSLKAYQESKIYYIVVPSQDGSNVRDIDIATTKIINVVFNSTERFFLCLQKALTASWGGRQ